MTRRSLWALALIGSALISCNTKHTLQTIAVNPDAAVRVVLDSTRVIPLENGDSSMLYDINTLVSAGDRLIIHSRNYLKAFDKGGRYLCTIAKEGHNEGDFRYIGNVWAEGDTIRVFDTNASVLLSYSPMGEYLGAEYIFGKDFDASEKPRQCFAVPGVGVFARNLSSDGTTATNPQYSFYNFGDTIAHAVAGRQLREPMFLADGTFVDADNGRLLSWDALRDTIFEVDTASVRPLYHVDFGEYALPEKVQGLPLLLDRIKVYNNGSGPYASLVRYVQKVGNMIYFSFAYGDENNFIVSYDTEGGRTAIKRFANEDRTLSQTSFFKIEGDTVYVEMKDRTDLLSNPYLYKAELSELQ